MPPSSPAMSIVIPMRDESRVLDELLGRIEAMLSGLPRSCEVIAVDDGSVDDTWQRLREAAASRPWLRGIRLARNFGQHPATFAGLEAARGPVIATMDADMQVPPEDMTLLIAHIDEGADIAFGARGHEGEGFIRSVIGPAVHSFLARHAAGRPPGQISTFLAAKRAVVEKALLFKEQRPVTPFHLMLGGPKRVDLVAVENAPRAGGATKYGAFRLMRLAGDVFFAYTDLAWPAIVAGTAAVPLAALVFWLPAVLFAIAGWEAISLVLLMAGAVVVPTALAILISLAAEMALRARGAVSRPLYLVTETF